MVYEKLVGQLRVGLVVSVTVTLNEHEVELPPLLTAVQATTVVPSPKVYGRVVIVLGEHKGQTGLQ